MRRLQLGAWLDLGLLVGVVFVMTVKPTAGEHGALAIAAAVPVASAVLGLALFRAEGRSTRAELPARGTS